GEDCGKDSDCDSNSCMDDKCVDKKAVGDDCSKDDECNSGTCSSGKCAGKKAEGEDCEADEDCDSGYCEDDKCSASSSSSGKLKRVWIGLGVQFDFYFLPGADNVCKVVDKTGNPMLGYAPMSSAANDHIVPNAGDQVIGGVSPLHNVRLLATFDYALNQNMMVGARAGYVLGTAPSSAAFAPIHIEARFTYLFGKNALTHFFAPYAFLGVGAGEFDAHVPVTVHITGSNGADNKGTENAWITAGPVFFAVGGGLRFGLTRGLALTAGIKFEGAIGGSAGFLPG